MSEFFPQRGCDTARMNAGTQMCTVCMSVLFEVALADLCSVASSSFRSSRVQGCSHRCLYKVGVKWTVRRRPTGGAGWGRQRS